MMVCSRCKKEWDFAKQGHLCPACGTPAPLPAHEAEEVFHHAVRLEQDRKSEEAFALYSLLASAGYRRAVEEQARCLEEGIGTARDYARAADGYFAAVECGSERAAFRLGRLLLRHPRVGGERGTAAFWLRAAVAFGNMDAALLLAVRGERCGLSEAERLAYLDIAARGGSAPAIRRLGRAYLFGRYGVKKDAGAALWVYSLLPRPSALRQFLIRRLYKDPTPTEPKPTGLGAPASVLFSLGEEARNQGFCTTALHLYLLATEKGSTEAALRAAEAYLSGSGAPVDRAVAERLYLEAEGRGSAEAGLVLGRLCEERGDIDDAERHYLAAAEHGMTEHWNTLGEFYCRHDKNGSGARRAVPWLRRAAEGGCAPAKEKLAEINARLSDTYARAIAAQEAGDVREAYALLENAAALGHADALSDLGYCLQKGIGCPQDLHAAARAYLGAVEAGSEAARINLAVCYIHGLGIARDFARAEELLRSAAKPYREAARRLLADIAEARAAKRAHRLYIAAAAVYHRGDVDGALRLRLEAARAGSPRAAYMIGCHFEFGDGVALDRDRAQQWYAKAAEGGFLGGHSRLKGGYLREKRRFS